MFIDSLRRDRSQLSEDNVHTEEPPQKKFKIDPGLNLEANQAIVFASAVLATKKSDLPMSLPCLDLIQSPNGKVCTKNLYTKIAESMKGYMSEITTSGYPRGSYRVHKTHRLAIEEVSMLEVTPGHCTIGIELKVNKAWLKEHFWGGFNDYNMSIKLDTPIDCRSIQNIHIGNGGGHINNFLFDVDCFVLSNPSQLDQIVPSSRMCAYIYKNDNDHIISRLVYPEGAHEEINFHEYHQTRDNSQLLCQIEMCQEGMAPISAHDIQGDLWSMWRAKLAMTEQILHLNTRLFSPIGISERFMKEISGRIQQMVSSLVEKHALINHSSAMQKLKKQTLYGILSQDTKSFEFLLSSLVMPKGILQLIIAKKFQLDNPF